MQAYLAEKYMSGPKADAILARSRDKKKKKRRAEDGAPTSGGPSRIRDEDATGWAAAKADDEPESEGEKAVVASDRGFKKRRTDGNDGGSGWATVRAPTPTPPEAEDEKPLVVEPDEPFAGGLLTKAQIRKHLPSAQVAKKGPPTTADEQAAQDAQQETIYRDATGRKIDTAAEKAEAARRKREREEREAQKMEWGKGLVQRDDERKRKEDLEKMRGRGGMRRADDKEMNEDMKAQERWNDPAAQFMTVRLALVFYQNFAFVDLSRILPVEEESERSAKTRIHWTAASTQPLWNQTRLQMGWRR
jgi:pre-mRNA-splicing factor CWC26